MNETDNLTNGERQYAEAVQQSVTGGRINGAFRMSLIKKGRELSIPVARCAEIEKMVLSATVPKLPPQTPVPPPARVPTQTNSAPKEEQRIAELERKLEETRREAQRMEEARRIAELERKLEETRREALQAGETPVPAEQASSKKRGIYLLLGIFLGWLGCQFAYAGRWLLFGLHWVLTILMFVAAGIDSDAMGGLLVLASLALWIGGTFFIGKDGHGEKMKWS